MAVLGLVLFSGVHAQNPRKNLTTILQELSSEHKVAISFSSTFTDGVYPHNFSMEGDLPHILTNLLKGSPLAFRQLKNGHYLIFKRKETVTPSKVKEKKVEEPVKTAETSPPAPVVIPMADFAIPAFRDTTVAKLVFPVQPVLPTPYRVLPRWGVKSNLLYDATTTLNVGLEFGLAEKWTLDVSANFNPWKYSDNIRLRHWMVQPELRYWLCERFAGHFFGVHAHYSQYNVGALPDWSFISENMKRSRYQGYLYGAGLSYGYHWILGNKWSIETSLGIGYARLHPDKYPCTNCGERMKNEGKNYFGPTKAAISLIYIIK